MYKFRKIKYKFIVFYWFDKMFIIESVVVIMKSMLYVILKKFKRKCFELWENLFVILFFVY